jgi:hypothetical protein
MDFKLLDSLALLVRLTTFVRSFHIFEIKQIIPALPMVKIKAETQEYL